MHISSLSIALRLVQRLLRITDSRVGPYRPFSTFSYFLPETPYEINRKFDSSTPPLVIRLLTSRLHSRDRDLRLWNFCAIFAVSREFAERRAKSEKRRK